MDVPLAIRSLRVAPDGRISLEMWNVSDKPVRLWRDSNTWGAARWRVLRVRAGELRVAHQRIVEGFTVNLPVFDELAPQARLEVTLDLSQPRWSGTIDAQPGDTVIVLYDVPLSNEAIKDDVWYGVVGAVTQMGVS